MKKELNEIIKRYELEKITKFIQDLKIKKCLKN